MTPKTPNWDGVEKMYGAWADRDDIDEDWLDELRSSWDTSLEVLMQDDTSGFSLEDVELLTVQDAAADFQELWHVAKQLFPTADDTTLSLIISFSLAVHRQRNIEGK